MSSLVRADAFERRTIPSLRGGSLLAGAPDGAAWAAVRAWVSESALLGKHVTRQVLLLSARGAPRELDPADVVCSIGDRVAVLVRPQALEVVDARDARPLRALPALRGKGPWRVVREGLQAGPRLLGWDGRLRRVEPVEPAVSLERTEREVRVRRGEATIARVSSRDSRRAGA